MNAFITILKLSPIVVLCGLVMSGFDMLMAAPLAFLYAVVVCRLTTKRKVTDVIEGAVVNVKNAIMIFFIFMLAYGVAALFMVTGVGASVIMAALKLGISGRNVAVVAFIVTCILSVGTGTSWGTYAATIPIFIWMSHIVGGDPVLTMCACAGGAAFGDNVALISDTTIMTCGIQNVQAVDRFRKQLFWSISCLVISSICFYVAGFVMHLSSKVADASQAIANIPQDAWAALEEERPAAVELLNQVADGNIPLWMMLPIVVIIVLAVLRFSTMTCLTAGILSATVLGACIGTVSSFGEFMQQIYDAFADAGSWIVVMVMWVIAFGGVMREMDAFRPLAMLCLKASRKVRHLMFCNAILCILGNMLLSDDQAQMATMGPVIKEIVDDNVEGSEEALYDLRCRNAMYGDAIGVLTGELIPWHVCNIYYVGLCAAIYPLATFTAGDLLSLNFFAWISIGSLLILTLTGWDRFIPGFKIPAEPDVKLKKNIKLDAVLAQTESLEENGADEKAEQTEQTDQAQAETSKETESAGQE